MTFRLTHRTNDLAGWARAVFFLPLPVFFGFGTWAVWADGRPDEAAIGGCGTVMFTALAFFAAWEVIVSHELECVVADGVIRWGRTARPDRQRRVSLSDVRLVVVGEPDTSPSASLKGRFFPVHLGGSVLRWDENKALVAFLRANYPDVRIEP